MSKVASTKSHPPRVTFASITSNNLGTVRKLNSVLFPIRYSEKFYTDILLPEVEDFCKLVYYNDIPVGTICCRLENKDDQHVLYLMTMGILAVRLGFTPCNADPDARTQPYRSRRLGSQALELILATASTHSKPKVGKIYLHVQISNQDAKRFYERHGFQEAGIHKDYYKKIEPRDAWILEKSFV